MPITKVVVTLDSALLARLDRLVAQQVFSDRSETIRAALEDKLVRMRRSPLARECAKLDPQAEQVLAEEGVEQELATWPEY